MLFEKEIVCEDGKVLLALQMIREKACQGLRVEDLSQATGWPRRTLERRFQKYLKSSPHYEILRTQIAAAKHLLQNSSLKLKDVAQQSGFKSVSHLCVAMKRICRKTPVQIRKETLLCQK